jgi:hypothetical protein
MNGCDHVSVAELPEEDAHAVRDWLGRNQFDQVTSIGGPETAFGHPQDLGTGRLWYGSRGIAVSGATTSLALGRMSGSTLTLSPRHGLQAVRTRRAG